MSEMPSSSYTLLDIPAPNADAGPCPSRCRGARPGLPARTGDQRDPPRFASALDALAAAADPLEGRGGAKPMRLSAWSDDAARLPARSSMAQGDATGCATAAGRRRSSATARATSPTWMHRFHRFRPTARSSRRPPARWATACRRRSPRSALAATRWWSLRRRWLLPDERTGIRHRRAIRPARSSSS